MSDNVLRSPDPVNPLSPSNLINESETGVRHPNRFEPTGASIPNTQLVRNDACRVFRNSALSIVTGDLIVFDFKSFDTTGIWNLSTGFIIPSTGKVTGTWILHAQVVWPSASGIGSNHQIDILKNGSVICTKAGPLSTTYQDITEVVNDPNRGDLFTLRVTHDNGGSVNLGVGSNKTYFSMVHTG